MGQSTFGWVDFAEADRRQMRDLIGLFRDSDTRDELGIGTIRDAFAEKLFPGTTTIQTRARYFLFIPWIYLRRERMETRSVQIGDAVRSDEGTLIEALLKSADQEGIIGRDAKDALKRFASEVYWSGLYSWGIRLFSGSRTEYSARLDAYYHRRRAAIDAKDDDGQLPGRQLIDNWHPAIPEAPPAFLNEAKLALTHGEAEFLQDRVLTLHPDSLLSFLLRQENLPKSGYVWEVPEVQALTGPLATWVKHARNFSDLMYGAAILYNVILAEKSGSAELLDQHRNKFAVWASDRKMIEHLPDWDLGEMWGLFSGIGASTRRFVETWIRLCLENNLEKLVDQRNARQLIAQRELQVKGHQRARIYSARARELWSGHAADYRLDYRWQRPVQTMIRDIMKPLLVQRRVVENA